MTNHLCDAAKKIDCITREAALDFLIPTYDLNISTQDQRILGNRFEEFLKSIPAADVRPVIRAHWEWDENGMDWNLGAWKCSHCHCKAETWWATDKHNPLYCAGSHFCGNCGADMRR